MNGERASSSTIAVSDKVTVKYAEAEGEPAGMAAVLDALAELDRRSAERHRETTTLVLETRGELVELRTRVEALEGRANSHDARATGIERKLADGIAEAKRAAGDVRDEVAGTLAGVEAHVDNLADGLAEVRGIAVEGRDFAKATADKLDGLAPHVDALVLRSIEAYAKRIEAAADKLTRAPQVKAAGSVAGAFAASAAITALFELLKHL